MKKRTGKVFVGLSGGVDSAVAALLLKEQGYDVVGVFLREYDLSLEKSIRDSIMCSQQDDRLSAIASAAALALPFEEWDFREEYGKRVVNYLVKEYRRGRTPNPDVMCNKHIKFGLFLKKARKQGAAFIATGHYVKKIVSSSLRRSGASLPQRGNRLAVQRLLQAGDVNKDQSYFLYALTQAQLTYSLFPLGDLTKNEVRSIARKNHLPNWNRKDSQGVCFIGKIPMKDFLKSHIPAKQGPLMRLDGTVIGTHDGAPYYTIGQRHGIGYAGGSDALAVTSIDIKKNIVVVASLKDAALFRKKLRCDRVNWIAGVRPNLPLRCLARIRYRQELQKCTVSMIPGAPSSLSTEFERPQRAITPGQAIVLYKDREMLGGGIIA